MALAKSIDTLRQELREVLVEDLAAALQAVKELLPETAEKHNVVLALLARLKDANKERFRNTIAPDDFQRRVDTIRAECFDLIDALQTNDFELLPAPGGPGPSPGRQGSVLYRVPQRMPVRKPAICTVRVAIDEDALFEDIVLDDNVRLRQRVEVSDMMKAELLDPEGAVFAIRPLSEPEQLVRPTGYTQWLFSVIPQIEGTHQLLVKVSMMEFRAEIGRYVPKEVSILETVTIVMEGDAATEAGEAPLKSTGESFALGPLQAEPKQNNPPPVQQSSGAGKGLRAAALFMAFLLLSTATTWAFTPEATRQWWVASLQDTTEAYTAYVERFHADPDPKTRERVETAWVRRVERTENLALLREYQRQYPRNARRQEIVRTLARMEDRTVEDLNGQAAPDRFERYTLDFPDGQRLAEVRRLAEAQPAERRNKLIPLMEAAAARTLQTQPDKTVADNLLTHFPEAAARTEVLKNLEQRPELRSQLEAALTENLQRHTDAQNARAVLETFPERHEWVQKTVETQPAVKKAVESDLRAAKQRVGSRSEAEEKLWQQACTVNTLEAYADFAQKYPQSTHRTELRARVKVLAPTLSPEAQDWAEAGLTNTPAAYAYFIQKYPAGPFTTEARQRLQAFHLSKTALKRLEAGAEQRLRRERTKEPEKK